jgi:hypothetical protein
MTTIESAVATIRAPGGEYEVDEAQLAAVSFLARYSGRTLEAYRHDLRGFCRVSHPGMVGGFVKACTAQVSPHWRSLAQHWL